ncbi:MAG: zinc ribbon domain-containing protein [Deltaproteobacteria bacterium]|nr:zinc ribbon domain-containing protein [Deltaproteobacteria bacterium]
MPIQNQYSLGSAVGKMLIKSFIAVVALLIIRAVLDNLPPLIHASPIFTNHSALSTGLGKQYYKQYLSIVKQYGYFSPEYKSLFKHYLLGITTPVFIYPISIVNAAIDTLIFAVLVVLGTGVNILIRARSRRLPDGGLIILFLILTVIVAIAYYSYMGVLLPLMGSAGYLYNWLFLLLALAPLVGVIVVGAKNLDAITEVLFSSMSKTLKEGSPVQPSESGQSFLRCPKCGATALTGEKFCGECGAPLATEIICPECGTSNNTNAKFCKKCGKPLS